MLLFLLLVLVMGSGVSSFSVEQRVSCSFNCSLMLAPSFIPNAGFGVFTLVDIAEGDVVGESDVVIPIQDHYKTLPYRGQQQFLSWLGYIWPSHTDAFYPASTDSFPTIPMAMYKVDHGLNMATGNEYYDAEGNRISAFAPGLASLANSSPRHYNIQQSDSNQREFVATRNITAGSELLLYYGYWWHKEFSKNLASETEYDDLEDHLEKLFNMELPTEAEKRETLKLQRQPRLEMDDDDEYESSENDYGENPEYTFEEYEENDGEQGDCIDENENCILWALEGECDRDPTYMLEVCPSSCYACGDDIDFDFDAEERVAWLEHYGLCLDMIRAGPSSTAPNETGAIAKTRIEMGDLIVPVPLLVIKRTDLHIYEANETQTARRNVLNLENIVGEEELLNYCYGHDDSELLLLPFSPIVNSIQHSREPNAEFQWEHQDVVWLGAHPLEVLEKSGKLLMGLVALRDIEPGEEIVIDFGQAWERARNEFNNDKAEDETIEFRKERGVPDGFYPEAWMNQPTVYELAPLESPLKPGELSQMTFKHNGKPVCKNCYRIGLPPGFSQQIREFSDQRGITSIYDKLLNNDVLDSDEWTVFQTKGEEWFAQKYMNREWAFNMHYVAAWDEAARTSFLRALGKGGFDVVLESVGTTFGLENMTCFHLSFMGVSEADDSFTHTDVYASDEKGFNIIFPIIVVDGSSPELDVVGDDANIILSLNYEYDVAFVLGDNAYHKTSPNSYEEKGQKRIVVGAYCGQIDETTARMFHHIYDGEDPAPFCWQFESPFQEIHWGNGHSLPK